VATLFVKAKLMAMVPQMKQPAAITYALQQAGSQAGQGRRAK